LGRKTLLFDPHFRATYIVKKWGYPKCYL